mmetsp:Transcript_30986/g.68036  ORF Transcript_30986/g.68036 Transcript_30986/m.68036 type:complete len:384 (+) Transcript_30986:71-1222(+)
MLRLAAALVAVGASSTLRGIPEVLDLFDDLTPQDFSTYTFSQYAAQFQRVYSSAEERAEREALFNKRLGLIIAHNANPNRTWTAGVNQFTDWTEAQMSVLRGRRGPTAPRGTPPAAHSLLQRQKSVKDLPKNVDWRKKGAVTPVPDQGSCGSCWAVTAAGAIESHLAISTGHLEQVSAGLIRDCTPNPNECGGQGGCSGSIPELAFNWTRDNGMLFEKDYPYKDKDGKCYNGFLKPASVSLTGYRRLIENDQRDLMEALLVGPVAVSVAVPLSFSMYKAGVLACGNQDEDWLVGHAVLMVGYGESLLGKYWLVKNSWGEGWGDKGYIRIRREDTPEQEPCGIDVDPSVGSACKPYPDSMKVCGHCGILSDSSYPLGVDLIHKA